MIERGERRLVRIEEDGSRTPLVLALPPVGGKVAVAEGEGAAPVEEGEGDASWSRIRGDGTVLPTPGGDLILTDGSAPGAVFLVRDAAAVPPLPMAEARGAHAWTELGGGGGGGAAAPATVQVLLRGMGRVDDVALGRGAMPGQHDGGGILYASGLDSGGRPALVRIELDLDLDLVLDEDGIDPASSSASSVPPFLDQICPPPWEGSAAGAAGPRVAVDDGGNVYATCPGGVAVADSSGTGLGFLPLHSSSLSSGDGGGDSPSGSPAVPLPTAIEIGEDGYLYVATEGALYRVAVRVGPATFGTGRIVRPHPRTGTDPLR